MQPRAIARYGGCRREATLLALVALLLAAVVERCSAAVGAGSWKVIVENAGVSAMHMAVVHTNKVVMFDRTDFGPSQILLPDGRCRNNPLDLALKVDCYAHSIELDIQSTQEDDAKVFADIGVAVIQELPARNLNVLYGLLVIRARRIRSSPTGSHRPLESQGTGNNFTLQELAKRDKARATGELWRQVN